VQTPSQSFDDAKLLSVSKLIQKETPVLFEAGTELSACGQKISGPRLSRHASVIPRVVIHPPTRDSVCAIIIPVKEPRIVVDTNVLVGSLISASGHNRAVLRDCFEGRVRPIIGEALFHEYEDVLSRETMFRKSPLSVGERVRFFEAFLSICDWIQVYYLWRPNLRDETDNHLIELAVAGSASMIVTNNVRDFRGSELRFTSIKVVEPGHLRKAME
jgi:putative PIN family toxin of toxin-antitoxin system